MRRTIPLLALACALSALLPASPGAAQNGKATGLCELPSLAKRSFLVETGALKPGLPELLKRYGVEKRRPASEATVESARGEAESFQVILTSPAPKRLAVAPLKLAGPFGAVIPTDSVRVFRVGYVPTNSGQRLPDPLYDDLNMADPQDPCALWVTITVPPSTTPGDYEGALRIDADGRALSVPVRLKVWNFDLPKRSHLRTDFWFFRAQIRRHYGREGFPGFREVSKYLDLALEHRLTPIDCNEGNVPPLFQIYREADGKLTIDWTDFDRYAQYVIDRGGNSLSLVPTQWFANWFSDKLTGAYDPAIITDRATGKVETVAYPYLSKEHQEMLKWYLRAAVAHFREKGWLQYAFVQPLDEVPETEQNRLLLQTLRDSDPAVKILIDVITPKNAQLFKGLIDIWCPLSPSLPGGGFEAARAEGKEVWWYVCCGPRPPYANLFANQSAVDHRQLFWQSWKYNSQGVLYWGINFWNWWGNEPKYDVKTAWPNSPWLYGNRVDDLVGDGYFIYPGPNGPLGSIRLEAIRDGMEDYEYLWLLDARVKAAEKRGVSPRQLDSAKKLLAIPESFCKDLVHFSRSDTELLSLRRQAAEEILKLR